MPRTITLLLLTSLSACGDIGPKPRSEAPGLEATGDLKGVEVEMSGEEVSLVLSRDGDVDRLDVEAVFHMRNLGGETAFEEGFPIGPVKNMRGFSAAIDGVAVEPKLVDRFRGKVRTVTEEEAGKYDESGKHDYWYVWDAVFPAKAERTHVVKYRLDLDLFSDFRVVTYVLETGARWKNPIGKAVVTFRCASPLSFDNVLSAHPLEGGVRKGDALVWTFTEFEPAADQNIEIRYNTARTWDRIVADLREKARRHWSGKKELAWTLSRAHERFARATRSPEDRDVWLDALEAIFAEATEVGGRIVMPADEPLRIPGGSDPPEGAPDRETREYAEPAGAGRLFEFFDSVLEAAREDPQSPKARRVLGRWVAVAEAFLAGNVLAGDRKLEFPEGIRKPEEELLRGRIGEARKLLK